MEPSIRNAAGILVALSALILAPMGCDSRQAGALSVGELSAPDAWALANRADMTLVDIRTPREWRQTGVPAGALEIDMHHPGGLPGFADELLAVVGGDRSTAIGLICRTGNRSGQMQQALLNQGFTRIYNIREGMAGSRAGPGWLRRGLPVESCKRC